MSASLKLFDDINTQVTPSKFFLGEVDIGVSNEGQAKRIYGKNNGTTTLRGVNISVDGEAANHIKLAIDKGGKPGVWASPGEGIRAHNGKLEPGEIFVFWSKATFSQDDVEGIKPFEFVVQTVNLG